MCNVNERKPENRQVLGFDLDTQMIGAVLCVGAESP